MGTGALILWSHALAALLFGALAVARARDADAGLPRGSLILALAMTTMWALAVAGIDGRDIVTKLAEGLRNLAWFGFLWALLRQSGRRVGVAVGATFVLVALVCATTALVAIAETGVAAPALASTRLVLRMIVAVSGLALVHHLALAAAPASRGGARLALYALAAMWGVDLLLFASAWATGRWFSPLVAARGLAMALSAGMLAVALQRGGDWTLKLSRTVALRGFFVGVVIAYLVAITLATSVFAGVGGAHARVIQTAFVAGATATLFGVLASPWLRAWVKVKVAKHLFDHRYDYRHEWLRFTATLGRSEAGAAPLAQRLVQAIADLTDSPGGLLLVPAGDSLDPAGAWNWQAEGTLGPRLARQIASSDRILDLDALRREGSDGLPGWLIERADAWAVVPLSHMGELAGAVILARPPIDRALDWEDFDLLRVAGRQAASYLAEERAAGALSEARRFEEFNRRFAFIMHDVKNLVSQLSLVARNAERHADNPAFRADMIATLQDSCGRMSALLQRLSQHSGTRAESPRATDLVPILSRLARQRRGQHPVVVCGDHAASALVDPARFEQIIAHLLQNAIEASRPEAPVTLAVENGPGQVTVAVVDTGSGMTPAFVRDELFRPFSSSKDGGFGIGAFEARQLAEAMGGAITVHSRPGRGTRFAITFPAIPALEAAA